MKKYNYNKRKVCIVTTNRADYGHLRNLILSINKNKNFILKLIVSGSHLSKQHGYSINEILNDKLPITTRISLDVKKDFNNDEIVQSLSKILIKFETRNGFNYRDTLFFCRSRVYG